MYTFSRQCRRPYQKQREGMEILFKQKQSFLKKILPLRLREQNLVERQKQCHETIPLERIQDRRRQG